MFWNNLKEEGRGFPGSPVIKNAPADAGGTGLLLGPRGATRRRTMELLGHNYRTRAPERALGNRRHPSPAAREQPCSRSQRKPSHSNGGPERPQNTDRAFKEDSAGQEGRGFAPSASNC